MDQKVTYREVDQTERVYTAKGDADSIEVFMPDSEKIDIEYATDSIMDLKYRNVTVGVISEEGVLYVPEDAKKLARDYLYSLSIVNNDIHVILDWNTVDGISMMKGDMMLMVHHATPEELTNAQKRTIGDRLAVSVTMTVDGVYVSQLGGKADIAVETEEDVKVYYVDTDGRADPQESTYLNGATHTTVGHFSIYLYTNGEVSSDISIYIIAAAIAILVLVALLVLLAKRRHDND